MWNINYKFIFATLMVIMFLSLTCVSAVEDNQTAYDGGLESAPVEEDSLESGEGNSFMDLRIQFASSNFTLEKDFTFDPHYDSSFEGKVIRINNDNIVIDGKGHTVNALGKCAIFDIRGINVTLKNITLMNGKSNEEGGAAYFLKSATVIDCKFIGNSASNGGALNFYTQSSVINCTFEGNTADNGGAIYDLYRGVSVSDCVFQNNCANNGGAIFCDGAVISNTKFINNVAENYGGALYVMVNASARVEYSIFEGNRGISTSYNIYLSYGANLVTNNLNLAVLSSGCFSSLQSEISNCQDNVLRLIRDYIYLSESDSELRENGIQIKKNLIIDGQGHMIDGANQARIFNIASEGVILKDIIFVNGVSNGGGAIYTNNGLTVDNCSFDNNNGKYGGGIYASSGRLTVTNSVFTHNGGTGAAILFYSGGFIDNCTFIDNSAGEGTIYGCAPSIYSAYTISNCRFINNHGGSGGAIYSLRSGKLNNNTFIGNTAGQGGAIYISEETTTISNSTFENNQADNGGAIYFWWGGSVANSVFTGNKASNLGGAIYCGDQVTQCLFTGNKAGNNGGAIFNQKGSITYSNFTSNTANNGGGGIYSEGGELIHLKFEANNANNGGGLYSTSGAVHYLNFVNNIARSNGGGLYLNSGRTVVECIFSSNTAGDKGGAIFFNGQSTVNNANFRNNSAKNGGAIYNNNLLTINNTNFKGDHAYSGGAIQITEDLDIHNTNFKDNFASEGTNYVNLIGDAKITLDNVTPKDVNPFKVSTISVTYVTNGTAYGDNSNITVKVTSENKAITEGIALITLNGVNYTVSIIDGMGILDVTNVDAGRYACNITYISYNYTISSTPVDFYIVKKDVSFTVNISNITVGETLIFTVEIDNGENINEGTMSTIINNREYVEDVVNGTAKFEIPNLNVDDYVTIISYNDGKNYYNPIKSVRFSVLKRNIALEAYIPNIIYGDVLKITANVTSDNTILNEGYVLITINNNTYLEHVINGVATFEIPCLNIGDYTCNVSYIGGENNTDQDKEVGFSVGERIYTFEVDRIRIYGNVTKITVSVESNGESIVKGKLFLEVNGNVYERVLEDASAIFEIPMLTLGMHTANIVLYAEDGSTFQKENFSFEVPEIYEQILGVAFKSTATISASNKAFIINYGGKYSVTINGVVGEKVTFILNGKNIGSAITNAHGVATIYLTAKILKAAKAGTKNLVVELDSTNYQASAKKVKITINKEKTKIVAKKKTFKMAKKVKKYLITLKNSKGKAVKNAKVTLKINKKTYKANTNKNGKAIFKIKKLTKKGTFKAKITFKGNNCYKKVTKTVKIKVRG